MSKVIAMASFCAEWSLTPHSTHITGHFWDESIQAINCTGTDNRRPIIIYTCVLTTTQRTYGPTHSVCGEFWRRSAHGVWRLLSPKKIRNSTSKSPHFGAIRRTKDNPLNSVKIIYPRGLGLPENVDRLRVNPKGDSLLIRCEVQGAMTTGFAADYLP